MEQRRNMRLENDLGKDPIGKLVFRIAIPSMLAQLVSVLYGIVDRVYIGNIPEVGSLALAGAGVCGPILTLVAAFAFWIGIGGSPLMSIRMGEGKLEDARKIMSNCFMLLTVCAVALTTLALLVRRPLLLFGASESTLTYALDYYTIYVCGTLFALLSTGMNQFIICQGFAKKGMISVMLGAVLNILLDPLFIFVFNLGVRGAAIATVISQLASCVYVLSFLAGPVPPVRIALGGYQWKIIRRVLVMGLAPFLMYAIDSLMVIALNTVLQRYGGQAQGDQLVAAATISQSFLLLVTLPLGGITGGTGSILGFNFGAGRPDRIWEAEKYILALGLIFTSTLMLLAQGGAVMFAHLFTPDPQVAALAARAVRLTTLGIIPLALQYVVVDGFTGMGMMQLALPLSLLRKVFYFTALFLLPLAGGAMAAFFAQAASDIVPPMISALVYWNRRSWVTRQADRRSHAQEIQPAVQNG
ncbi:MATE family efflux transporter [Lawsonibacter sp. LCP25S3_G6]|uniref:MATE family efflux transporter n=1 Tax=unclassified Lawsonibacter TaxID=2617946 RepID=UPI003F9C8BBF